MTKEEQKEQIKEIVKYLSDKMDINKRK